MCDEERGGGGGQIPPFLRDVICGWPLLQMCTAEKAPKTMWKCSNANSLFVSHFAFINYFILHSTANTIYSAKIIIIIIIILFLAQ